ncbi:hypothetical protein ACMD2_22394 [Ananas comosus]|uniref:UBA domain-containing protein n=1 Tax=Ananas comosus TaxID=4615 RepID=A0A199V588_ANACO|nr:hypothetical protein ACMD2_22394 [Ananas comosus]
MLDEGGSPQVSWGETVCDETAILKVMEFLALPRADAIHLLMQCNGNAETAVDMFTVVGSERLTAYREVFGLTA